MKKFAFNLLIAAAFCALAYWFLTATLATSSAQNQVKYLAQHLTPINVFYHDHWLLTVLLFSCAHLICSALSLPGSCSLLNILAGAIFGFWAGCAIVYPVTMLSALLTYFAAEWFAFTPLVRKYSAHLDGLKKHIQQRDYFFFVALRLNPLVPFGIINILLGLLRVPFKLYLLTTFVGIFFDVTLFNNIGAGLHASSTTEQSQAGLAITFFVLVVAFLVLRGLLPKSPPT